MSDTSSSTQWPSLPAPEWLETIEVLHLWTQVVGKIRLGYAPWLNHSWGVPLYVSTRGLRSSPIPYGGDAVELEFDFFRHALTIHATTGKSRSVAMQSGSVAEFHDAVLAAMDGIGMPVEINPMPCEIPGATPLDRDVKTRHYDPEHAHTLWRALVQSDRVLTRFRADFKGKASPVHFFWGSFDLAVTRFSGRSAPPHPGGIPHLPDDVAREAYSEEVTSAGFWPGNGEHPTPVFYSYAYPSPEGFSNGPVKPEAASWNDELGEFVLPYDVVASAENPDEVLLSFLDSAHAVAAELTHWDRSQLECQHPEGPDWWHHRSTQT